MASSTPTGAATTDATDTTATAAADRPTATGDLETAIPDDWESIRYVFYLVGGWLLATAIAVLLLMFVAPALF